MRVAIWRDWQNKCISEIGDDAVINACNEVFVYTAAWSCNVCWLHAVVQHVTSKHCWLLSIDEVFGRENAFIALSAFDPESFICRHRVKSGTKVANKACTFRQALVTSHHTDNNG